MFGKYPGIEDKERRAKMEAEFVELQSAVSEDNQRALASVIHAAVRLDKIGIPVIVRLTDEFQAAYNVESWVVASDFIWHCLAERMRIASTLELPF